jgi:hypothetical protein
VDSAAVAAVVAAVATVINFHLKTKLGSSSCLLLPFNFWFAVVPETWQCHTSTSGFLFPFRAGINACSTLLYPRDY